MGALWEIRDLKAAGAKGVPKVEKDSVFFFFLLAFISNICSQIWLNYFLDEFHHFLVTSQNPSKKPWFKVPVAGGPIPSQVFCLFFVTQWAEEIRAEMAISQHYHFTEPAAPHQWMEKP